MERIFWAECPHCRTKFYCNYGELRHSGIKLACPSCKARFLPSESASLDEREQSDGAFGAR
jgi:predicted Zn finger-like uncharacterized protein